MVAQKDRYIKRADIKRIGFNCKVGYPMTTQHRIMARAHNNLTLEFERELHCLADIGQFDVDQSDRVDIEGEFSLEI